MDRLVVSALGLMLLLVACGGGTQASETVATSDPANTTALVPGGDDDRALAGADGAEPLVVEVPSDNRSAAGPVTAAAPSTAAGQTTVTTIEQSTVTTAKPSTTEAEPTTTTPPPAPARTFAYRGVDAGQWAEIESRRSQNGDPNDCRARIDAIATAADVVISPGDDRAIVRAIDSGARVIELRGGTHTVADTVELDGGQQLIGAAGQDVVIRAAGVPRAVFLDNGAVLSNVVVLDADDEGVVLNRDSLVHRVSVGRTGYNGTYNESGTGLVVRKGGSNNCIVSAETYEGFNEGGADHCPACSNGGNADGMAVRFGALNNTIIDTHAYRNSDDGFDFWEAGSTFVYFGSSFDNGEIPDRPAGDGNGFKLGRGDATHHVYKAVAESNVSNGFDLNGNARSAVLVQTRSSGNGGRDYVDVVNS